MEAFVSHLHELFLAKSRSSVERQKTYLQQQLSYLENVRSMENVEEKLVGDLLLCIQELEIHKEYLISEEEFLRIVKEKDVEKKFVSLFPSELNILSGLVEELYELLVLQTKGNPADYFDKEEWLYTKIKDGLAQINLAEDAIRRYFDDMQKLTYKKSWVKFSQVLCRVVGKKLFRVKVTGLENIPQDGPCFIAPHHHQASFDEIFLSGVVPRPLFYITSVESFVATPFLHGFYEKIGCLPFVRDDTKFPPRKKNKISSERVQEYASKHFGSPSQVNMSTLKKILIHVKHGDAVVFFPEGDAVVNGTYERDEGQEFLPAQEGVISIAILIERKYGIRVPIVPIGFSYGMGYFGVCMNIGKPLHLPATSSMTRDQVDEVIKSHTFALMSRIKELSKGK